MSNYENRSSEVVSGGLSLPTVLFLIFLVLKLVGVISWSWWWVTAPLWISAGLSIVIILGIFATYGIIKLIKARRKI